MRQLTKRLFWKVAVAGCFFCIRRKILAIVSNDKEPVLVLDNDSSLRMIDMQLLLKYGMEPCQGK